MDDIKGVTSSQLEELVLLLEDRSFVDYFNIFLCLPVFGQHAYYNHLDAEFDFEPPIPHRRNLYLDKREVLIWLYKERYSLFKLTPLSTEYRLCSKLKASNVSIPGIKKREEARDGHDSCTLIKNVIGTALGMLMFRESLRDTCGETVYRCWRDIEAWRHLEDGVRRAYWKNVIKNKYIREDSASALKSRVKVLVFQGSLSFDLFPEDMKHKHTFHSPEACDSITEVESDKALLQLQDLLLDAMRKYWVPRFILHFKQTASKNTVEVLTRPAPGDLEYLSKERRLRCRFMFPSLYQETSFSTPTSVFVSQSAGELPHTPGSLKDSSLEEQDLDELSPVEDELSPVEDELSPVEDEISPTALFNLWTGPAKDIILEKSRTVISDALNETSSGAPSPLYESPPIRPVSFSRNHVPRSPIPITLLSYLGGKKRTILGKFPSVSDRVSWSLACDGLAGGPFRTFLFERGYDLDLKYLHFWTDVRNYLDTDDSAVDGYGFPLKRQLAHRFMETCLSQSGIDSDLFSESLKNALFSAFGNANDVSLLCMAQDIVLENLWEPLKLYIQDERRRFLKQVRGHRYRLKHMKTRAHLQDFRAASAPSLTGANETDPMYFFQCSTVRRGTASNVTSPISDVTMPQSAVDSRAMTSYHICISEEQMWKAMELTVLCSEYGVSMMMPQYPPKPEQLVDVLHGEYGSLHVTRVPAKRNEFLRNLLFPPKINIKTIKVSRKVELEKIDLSLFRRSSGTDKHSKRDRLVIRRNGMLIERPPKPKTFSEVLMTPAHYDFFKRFLVPNKATMPLFFWKAVEELKEIKNLKTRSIRVSQIMRKFFGKNAKYGALLECHEDIVRQIPNMDKVTAGILICAQAAVFRSMERNWYPLYLDTYPLKTDSPGSQVSRSPVIPTRAITPDVMDVIFRVKPKKRKLQTPSARRTTQTWRNLVRQLVEFWKAMTNPSDTKLLEIFLKYEIEKEQQNMKPAETAIEKNILMSTIPASAHQARAVIRNRLVILNRLPADLHCWLEIQKYITLVDGIGCTDDSEFLTDKARAIISCFLASDVPPRIQVNVPNDVVANIINSLISIGPTRGLFHDLIYLLFPALHHYWKKYSKTWKLGNFPESYVSHMERMAKIHISQQPHAKSESKDYTQLDVNEIKPVHQVMFDDTFVRIHFSISEGVTIVYPQTKIREQQSSPQNQLTTKHLLPTRSAVSNAVLKESKHQLQPGDKNSRVNLKQKHDKIKEEEKKDKKKKIFVKDPNESGSQEQSPDKPNRKSSIALTQQKSTDRAHRLSHMVETLEKERTRSRKSSRSNMLKLDEAIQEISESSQMF